MSGYIFPKNSKKIIIIIFLILTILLYFFINTENNPKKESEEEKVSLENLESRIIKFLKEKENLESRIIKFVKEKDKYLEGISNLKIKQEKENIFSLEFLDSSDTDVIFGGKVKINSNNIELVEEIYSTEKDFEGEIGACSPNC